MSGIFGVVSKGDCAEALFYGTDCLIIKYIKAGEIILISRQRIAQKREIYPVNSVLLL